MDTLERSDASEQLLQNPVFRAAYKEVHAELVRGLEMCGFMDIETQHELTVSLQLLNRLKKRLERWVEDGKVEKKTIEQQNWLERARQRLVR